MFSECVHYETDMREKMSSPDETQGKTESIYLSETMFLWYDVVILLFLCFLRYLGSICDMMRESRI
jgi:hypothetical protein